MTNDQIAQLARAATVAVMRSKEEEEEDDGEEKPCAALPTGNRAV